MLEEIFCAGRLLGRRWDASLESRCLSEAQWEDEEEKHSRKMEQQMQSLRGASSEHCRNRKAIVAGMELVRERGLLRAV